MKTTKRLIFCFLIMSLFSFTTFASPESETDDLKQWLRTYLDACESDDWREQMKPYSIDGELDPDFQKSFANFRNTYENIRWEIKHIVVEGNEVMALLSLKGKHVKKSQMGIEKNVEPTNKVIEWDEVWYFNVTNGKFGGKWDSIHDNITKMKQLGIDCLPEE